MSSARSVYISCAPAARAPPPPPPPPPAARSCRCIPPEKRMFPCGPCGTAVAARSIRYMASPPWPPSTAARTAPPPVSDARSQGASRSSSTSRTTCSQSPARARSSSTR